jgi:hypothetical protein
VGLDTTFNGELGSSSSGVHVTSGVFQIWRGIGITASDSFVGARFNDIDVIVLVILGM